MARNIRPGATHYLVGVARGSDSCAHCGRSLKNLFIIADATGTQMVVGRTHAAQYTGWTPTVAEAEWAQKAAERDALYAAYLTHSAAGAELECAAQQEHAANLAARREAEARLGYRVDPASVGRAVFADAASRIAERLQLGWWSAADCDGAARDVLAREGRQ